MYTLCFDGLFRAVDEPAAGMKAGVLCYGWVIYKDHSIVARGHGVSAHSRSATSNVAEYLALIAGLEALQDMGIGQSEAVEVIGDSRTVIGQMSGMCGMRTEYARSLFDKAVGLAQSLPIRRWKWVSRDYNKDADVLTRRALMQVKRDQEKYEQTIRSIDPRGKSRSEQRHSFINLLDLRAIQPIMA